MKKQELEQIKKKFGIHVQKIRQEKDMSLLDVSYNCSLLGGRISEIEHGKFNITLRTLIELARGLEVHPSRLMEF